MYIYIKNNNISVDNNNNRLLMFTPTYVHKMIICLIIF